MKTLFLTLWLMSGTVIDEPTTEADCAALQGAVREVQAIDGWMSRDDDPVIRIACGDMDTVLMLPPSEGICDMEPST